MAELQIPLSAITAGIGVDANLVRTWAVRGVITKPKGAMTGEFALRLAIFSEAAKLKIGLPLLWDATEELLHEIERRDPDTDAPIFVVCLQEGDEMKARLAVGKDELATVLAENSGPGSRGFHFEVGAAILQAHRAIQLYEDAAARA